MASVKQFHISGDFFDRKPTILDQGEVECLIQNLLTPWEDPFEILEVRLANLEVGEYLSTTHIRAIIRLKDR